MGSLCPGCGCTLEGSHQGLIFYWLEHFSLPFFKLASCTAQEGKLDWMPVPHSSRLRRILTSPSDVVSMVNRWQSQPPERWSPFKERAAL